MVSAQSPVPAQPPPLQPAKTEPGSGTWLRVRVVPAGNGKLQKLPQSMPGLTSLETLPAPGPAFRTVRRRVGAGPALKVAATVWAALRVTWQVPVPVQPAPLQPAKAEPPSAAALRVTTVPLVKSAVHEVRHALMPA